MSNQQVSTPYFQVTAQVREKLIQALARFHGQKVVILGDVGLDEYVIGNVRRISPEAPVPVLEVETEDRRLGLAGNVAQNVKSLGGEPILVGVVGDDSAAIELKKLFDLQKIKTNFLVVDKERNTTRKSRVMAGHIHIVRVDHEARHYLSAGTEKKIMSLLEQELPEAGCLILEDYAKGLITPSLMAQIQALANRFKKPIYCDPHRSNSADFYRGVTLIKPNFDESLALTGMSYDDLRDHPDRVLDVGKELMKKTQAQKVVLTRGKEGMVIFEADRAVQVGTFARKVFDVAGAGDTVIASLALALGAGLELPEAAVVANCAAGVVVAQIGCVPCKFEELQVALSEL